MPQIDPQRDPAPQQMESIGSTEGIHAGSPLPGAGEALPLQRQGIPEFSELVLACQHRLLLTLGMGITASLGLLIAGWYVMEGTYKAESLVRVREHQDVVFAAQMSRSEDAAFVRSQAQLALSPQVLTAALADPRFAELSEAVPSQDAVAWLRSKLRAETQAGAEVLSIAAYDPQPDVAHVASLAVTQAYLNEVSSRLASDRDRRQAELERAALAAEQRLDELWANLNSIASDIGSDNSQSLTIRDEIQMQAFRDYAQQLRTAQLRGNELQSLLAEAQAQLSSSSQQSLPDGDFPLPTHPQIELLQRRIEHLDQQIRQIREVAAQPDTPRLKPLQEQRELFNAELQQLTRELGPRLREQSREQQRQVLEASVAKLQKQIELNQDEKEFLQARMAEIDTNSVQTDSKNGVQLEMARHAVDRQSHLADGLWQSLEELKIERQSQPRVSLLELAEFPLVPNHSRQLKAAAAGFGAGWILVVLGVGYLEWRSCRVRHSDDVARIAKHPLFGVHAFDNSATDQRSAASCKGSSAAREAAARLIMPHARSKHVPSLMVSSATDQEPQHMAALDLSTALAYFRRRTLLVDCNTSSTKLSELLKADHLPGLMQFDSAQTSSQTYVVPTSLPNLDFLPLGIVDKQNDWLEPSSLQEILREYRDQYDAIVFNGPPLLSSAESLLFAAQVEQTLLTVVAGLSRWTQLAVCQQYAGNSGIAVAGFLLQDTPREGTAFELHAEASTDKQTLNPPQTATQSSVDASSEDELSENIAAIQAELNRAAAPKKTTENRSPSHSESET